MVSSLGVLDDTKLEHVPGTVLLDDYTGNASAETHANLKHGTGKYAHIVLTPQPSDDPNDPLNWPLWRKDLALLTVALGCLLLTATAVPMLSPATYGLSINLDRPIGDIAKLTGYLTLTVGCFGPIVSMLATVWGKRLTFLISSLVGVVGVIICECANSYETLLTGRIITGLGCSAYESLIVSFAGDMYFVHQRGSRVTTMQLVSNSCGALSPIIAGVVYQHLGWKYLFHILLPCLATQLIMTFLFVPETTFRRSAMYETDTGVTDHAKELVKTGHATATTEEKDSLSDETPIPVAKTFWQRTAVYNGRFSTTNPFKLMAAPLVALVNPATFWACLTQGVSSGWWVSTSYVLAQIWSAPPYNLSAASVGYLYTGPIIGSCIGCVILAWGLDPLAVYLARRNKGVYEPEFRIPPVILAVITGAVGLFLYGNMVEAGKGYYVASLLHGIYGVSVVMGSGVANAYIVDAHRDEATEMVMITMMFKNFFFFQCSYWTNSYLAEVGPGKYFDVQGGTLMAIYATSVPMYIFGKKNRSWWARHDILKKFVGR